MGMVAPSFYTADMVRALPDDGSRYETVHGELLVTPAPRKWHQLVLGQLHSAILVYLEANPVGHPFFSPADISWGSDTLVQPDLFVVPLGDARDQEWEGMRRLLLAVEVLSPSSIRADRFTKRRLYQEQQVPLYWVVDGESRTVEEWRPDASLPRLVRDEITWRPGGAAAPFTMYLGELFRAI